MWLTHRGTCICQVTLHASANAARHDQGSGDELSAAHSSTVLVHDICAMSEISSPKSPPSEVSSRAGWIQGRELEA